MDGWGGDVMDKRVGGCDGWVGRATAAVESRSGSHFLPTVD